MTWWMCTITGKVLVLHSLFCFLCLFVFLQWVQRVSFSHFFFPCVCVMSQCVMSSGARDWLRAPRLWTSWIRNKPWRRNIDFGEICNQRVKSALELRSYENNGSIMKTMEQISDWLGATVAFSCNTPPAFVSWTSVMWFKMSITLKNKPSCFILD